MGQSALWWLVPPCPYNRPNTPLPQHLDAPDGKDYSFSEDEAELARENSPLTLVRAIQTFKKENDRWLIFVDQFEEIFTNCSNEQTRKNFIEALMQLNQNNDDSVRVVLAMRADFLEYFSAYPQLGIIANDNDIHLVTDMHPDELRNED